MMLNFKNIGSGEGEESRGRFFVFWRTVRIPLAVIFALFIGLVIYRIPVVLERQKTAETVEKIHAQKLTLADVTGERLPPEPDPLFKDATIEGIDVNQNGIRDDVELAIFKLHPDSARIRAAELQYAMALQTIITKVFNSETWKAVAFEHSRGYACISQTYPRENLQKHSQVIDERIKEVQDLIINTQARKDAENLAYDFTTSFGLANEDFCDVPTENL